MDAIELAVRRMWPQSTDDIQTVGNQPELFS